MEKKNKVNRRGFLKSSVIGATGIVVGQTALAGQSVTNLKSGKEEAKIVYRTLGKTGLKLPIVSMGVMRADNPNLVRAALDKGIRHLDSAHGYQQGRNEEMLGKLLVDYPRESYTISTKIQPTGQNRRTGLISDEFTREGFMDMFNISMERLGLEYVDILHHHGVSSREGLMYEPLVDIMKKIKKSGRARFLGLSTHSNEAEVLVAAAESGFIDVVLTAYNFTKNVDEMNAAIKKAADAGLGIIAMKTMAGGFFDRERQHPVNTQAALKWALQNPNVHTSIPGFTTFDHLEDSFSIMENPEMTEEEKNHIEEGKNTASLYCIGCQVCLNQCRNNLPVPDLMRAYMYTYGYRNLEKAYDLLTDLDLSNNPCKDCTACTITCTKKFDVAAKIKDVSRLLDVPEDFIV
ncbi:MAG: aldo/keto reductase [Bacteroidales bacterium]|nr:MAG: aldo/keto reductase [Bacteroidales bacterium]